VSLRLLSSLAENSGGCLELVARRGLILKSRPVVQVFISYSHNDSDTPLARYLAGRLRAIGITVWQDEASQPAGESLQDDIEKAIRESDHAIFIVSKLWLASRWSRLEVDRFDHRDRSKVRRVPVFRLPHERLKLPMELIDLKGITWLEDDPHHDARFWEVYCAITDTNPGPVEQWAAESTKLAPGSVVPPRTGPSGPTSRRFVATARCSGTGSPTSSPRLPTTC